MNKQLYKIMLILIVSWLTGCKKLVTVDPPISSLTTQQVFSNDAEAQAAIAGIYTSMINGQSLVSNSIYTGFAAGLSTYLGSVSSDEIMDYYGINPFSTNHLTAVTGVQASILWTSAYQIIYGANAVVEGLAASTTGDLHDSIRVELTAEAKFIRAYAYSYLVNFFGDVPLTLTVDFNKTLNMARTPKDQVYKQIIQDLKDAQSVLPADFSYGHGERIVPNKWAATALLARIYLYTADYADAAEQAGAILANTSQYSLVSNLNQVFLRNSSEAIWQLQQNPTIKSLGTCTPEGMNFIPQPQPHTSIPYEFLADGILNSFDPGDQRRAAWTDSTVSDGTVYYFPFKYKTGAYNAVQGGVPTEYYMALRLAEQYLIRAEAEAKGAGGGSTAAIADLNVLRERAGLADLPPTLTPDELWKAIAHERQTELFCEWGHRWFDLNRMGLAHDVLSQIPIKQPWVGDYQLLYPVPTSEIINDPHLTQNPGY